MGAELLLEARAGSPGPYQRGAGDIVDLVNLVEGAEVERAGAVVTTGNVGLNSTDDAGPAAVGDHRNLPGCGPGEELLDLLLAGRPGHEVGGVRVAAAEAADGVQVGAAACVQGPVTRVDAADRGQRSCGRLDTRLRHLRLGERDRLLRLLRGEAKEGFDTRRSGRRLRGRDG